jgi:hypothetical protein
VLCSACWHWQSADLARFVCYLAVAVLASSLKVQLPGIDGTMSVNFLFILLGVMELSLPETLVIGCTATLVQSVWHARKPAGSGQGPVQRFRNDGERQRALLCQLPLARRENGQQQTHSADGGGAGFLPGEHAADLGVVIALTEGKSSRKVWKECYFWSFPITSWERPRWGW